MWKNKWFQINSLQFQVPQTHQPIMDEEANITLFASLRGVVSPSTMEAIESLGFSTMTEIQALSLPPLLEGKDLRGTAKTGSGKTLAFLIPAIERLNKLNFRQTEGE